MIDLIFTIFTYLIFLVSSLIFLGGLYRRFKPFNYKIFFSYSHQDLSITEKIMTQLQKLPFKIWIDLNLDLPTDKIEHILEKNISKCEIFILIASKHSANSDWVKFEIEKAKEEKIAIGSRWRNFLILVVDDDGKALYTELEKYSYHHVQEFEKNSKEANNELQELLQATRKESYFKYTVLKFYIKLTKKIFGEQYQEDPTWKRGFTPTIDRFELIEPFESSSTFTKFKEYLYEATSSMVLRSNLYRKSWFLLCAFWLFGMAISGYCIIKDINVIELLLVLYRK